MAFGEYERGFALVQLTVAASNKMGEVNKVRSWRVFKL